MSSNEVIFHNTLGWSRVNAVFTGCGRTKQCKMDTLPNSLARCCIGAEFDDVYFTNGANRKTAHTAFNRLCSSFDLTALHTILILYAYSHTRGISILTPIPTN